MVGNILTEVTEQNFDEEVLNSHLPVFACFTTSWCSSCFPTCLVADELSGEYNGKVKFVKVDIEESLKIAEKHRIIAVPTILIFQDSHAVKRLLSYQDRNYITSILDSLVAE